jgi:SAM-dependent methyltransferase
VTLNFAQFRQVGRDQWRVQPPGLRRTFLRWFGPLGVHARIRNTRVINNIQTLDLKPGSKILDAGCGHAYATFWLAKNHPEYDFTAIELDPHLVRQGNEIISQTGLSNVKLLKRSVTDYLDEGSYDLIFSIDVLEHIVDDLAVLNNFHQGLIPGGQLLLHLPRRHQEHRRIFPVFSNHTTPDHVRDEYTADDIAGKLQQSGFVLDSIRYGFSPYGELAFELNYLFWDSPELRTASALLFHPLAVSLAYLDTRRDYPDGNSLIILAHRDSSKEAII